MNNEYCVLLGFGKENGFISLCVENILLGVLSTLRKDVWAPISEMVTSVIFSQYKKCHTERWSK